MPRFRKSTIALCVLASFILNACGTNPSVPTFVPTALPQPTLTPVPQAPQPIPKATQVAMVAEAPTQKPTQAISAPTETAMPNPTEVATANPTEATTTAKFVWTKLDSQNVPPARYDHALAFDSDKQQLILFGGRAEGNVFGDTWIFDLNTNRWREIKSQGPSARFGFQSVYDPKTKAVYLFGGQKDAFYNDTWKFDTVNETWSEIKTSGNQPDIRYGHGVTLDSKNDRLIISHGFARNGRHNDTWALDLSTKEWTELTPTGDKPLNRCLHDIAYAPASNAVYLFGGCSSGFGPCPQGDLWSLDLQTNQWTLINPQGEKPSPRQNPSIVVDSKTGNLILFGGKADNVVNDLWEFDTHAQTWKQIASQGPSARKSHDAVFDAINNRVYLFGGSTTDGAVNDLWRLEF